MTYPIIKVPQEIIEIISWNPLLDEQPIIPSAPKKLELSNDPLLPVKPVVPQLKKNSILFSSILLVVVIFYLFNLANNKSSVFFGYLAWGGIALLIYRLIVNSNKNTANENQYTSDSANYSKLVRDWELECNRLKRDHEQLIETQNAEYESLMKRYNAELLPEYNKKMSLFESYIKSNEAKKRIRFYKYERFEKYIVSHVSRAVEYESDQIPRRGVSEKEFYENICEDIDDFFDGNLKVFTNKTIIGSKYLPDLTLEYSIGEQKIYIDIEIDEPYVGSTGQPIHYVEGKDNIRDNFFIKNGWIVVRFSEEQVVNSSSKCFWLLLRIIGAFSRLIEGDLIYYLKNNLDKPATSLAPIKQWTKEEAHAMAFKRYRNTYLTKEFIENLSKENLDINSKLSD